MTPVHSRLQQIKKEYKGEYLSPIAGREGADDVNRSKLNRRIHVKRRRNTPSRGAQMRHIVLEKRRDIRG